MMYDQNENKDSDNENTLANNGGTKFVESTGN